MRTNHALLAGLLVGTLALTGCGGAAGNKAGAAVGRTTTLRLALPDVGDTTAAFFAKAVEKRSDGHLKITVDDSYDSAETTQEAKLPAALTAGTAQLAYLPARDLAGSDLPYFQALAAPFSVTTQEGMRSVAASHFATEALASLKAHQIVGLGLVPVEPRQFLSTRPLATPADFARASLRVVLDPAVGAAVSALGGTAADVSSSTSVRQMLKDGTLTGAETSPQYALSNGYVEVAPYLTAFGIYPKFQVVAVNQKVWAGLDDSERSALKAAVADTVARARAAGSREPGELASMCRQKAVVVTANAAVLAAIVKTASVDSSGYAAAARELAAVPGTGPQPAAVPIPASCTVADSASVAVAAYHRLQGQTTSGLPTSESTTIPDGTYETTTTVADLRAGGQRGSDWDKAITWTWHLRGGTVKETQKPDYPDQGPCGGTYAVTKDELTITWTSGSCEGNVEVTRWSFYQGQLSFQNVDVADSASKVIYAAHPWLKTG